MIAKNGQSVTVWGYWFVDFLLYFVVLSFSVLLSLITSCSPVFPGFSLPVSLHVHLSPSSLLLAVFKPVLFPHPLLVHSSVFVPACPMPVPSVLVCSLCSSFVPCGFSGLSSVFFCITLAFSFACLLDFGLQLIKAQLRKHARNGGSVILYQGGCGSNMGQSWVIVVCVSYETKLFEPKS